MISFNQTALDILKIEENENNRVALTKGYVDETQQLLVPFIYITTDEKAEILNTTGRFIQAPTAAVSKTTQKISAAFYHDVLSNHHSVFGNGEKHFVLIEEYDNGY